MDRARAIAVPPPAREPFQNGIDHRDLLLWDAWTEERGETLSLYTLAVARVAADGTLVTAANRDRYPFHVRRFVSEDGAESWTDAGAVLRPGGPAPHNVWSGSVLRRGGRLLTGLTGVRRPEAGRPFVQAVLLVEGEPPDLSRASVLSDPERDREAIEAAGYYLGPAASLGTALGEAGGPILAWRDPFLFEADGELRAAWSAKLAPARPCLASAVLTEGPKGWRATLRPPTELPDAERFTQAEVPKLYREPEGEWLLLVSGCDRRREDQPDVEVTKALRLYRGPSADGPWRPYRAAGSGLLGADHLFGGALTAVTEGAATLIAPHTEMAPPDRRYTFAPPRQVGTR